MRPAVAGFVSAAAAALTTTVFAGDLLFPVDCELGKNCFIQQYVDRTPGPGVSDFTCGPLSYNDHRGTDVRLVDIAAMNAGVSVISSTPGKVLGVRDGMQDRLRTREEAAKPMRLACGNGVLIERGDGWRFQYCHLKRGSVAVRKGDVVAAGAVLGQIGLSGQTQFPHVHLTIRNAEGDVVDPFDARPQSKSCDLPDTQDLWADLDASAYQAGGLLTSGFSDGAVEYSAVKAGTAHTPSLPADAPAMVHWAHFFGVREGDQLTLHLVGPDGNTVAESTKTMDRDRATQFVFSGRKRRGPSWPTGTYSAVSQLIRNGQIFDERQLTIAMP